MAVLGYDSTLPVTLDDILAPHAGRSPRDPPALLVADMPYGSFHVSVEETLRNAMRLVKEGGAEAVKVEGGERRIELIAKLVEAEIPVMGHIGLTPQSFNALGGFPVQGKTAPKPLGRSSAMRERWKRPAPFLSCSNPCPRELAARITEKLRIPTIGIGAGPDCDGQILVFHDLVGLDSGP